jgi:hypothetical protein
MSSDSNSLTSSILSEVSSTNTIESSSNFNFFDGSQIFETFKSINFTTIFIIILILAFLGFNIFIYLAKGTQDITSVFNPLFNKIFGTTFAVTGQTINVSAEGAKAVVAETAGVVNTGLTDIQDFLPNNSQSSIKTQPIQEINSPQYSTTNNSLETILNNSNQEQEQEYQAIEASSSVHLTGKSGWCYIGEDRGFRTCSQVGINDKCMSGNIFPSQELCINPNLRP